MIMTMRPTSVTVAAGTATWASTLAMATAVPGFNPIHPAACSVNPPARWPTGRISRDIFSSMTPANCGCKAAKYSRGGKPSRLDQIAL